MILHNRNQGNHVYKHADSLLFVTHSGSPLPFYDNIKTWQSFCPIANCYW